MSGSYCGIRLWFYLLMGVGTFLFVVSQLMATGNPSPGLKLEDCDGFRQPGQQVIEAATQTLDKHIGDTSEPLGGGGAPTEHASAADKNFWEVALASGECPPRNAG